MWRPFDSCFLLCGAPGASEERSCSTSLITKREKEGKKDVGDLNLITSVIYPLGVTLPYYGAVGGRITGFQTCDRKCCTSCGEGVELYSWTMTVAYIKKTSEMNLSVVMFSSETWELICLNLLFIGLSD